MTALSPERYDAWYRTLPGRWIGDREYELLRKCLAVRSDESILDVGCGTGFFTRRFAHNHCSTVIGVDLDAAAIRYASLHEERSEAYIVARGEALPFPSRSFDLSISITALCFVNDQMRFLREMARVTRRRVAVGLLNRRSVLWHRKGNAGEKSAYHGAHWHTHEEIIELLTAVGFSNISVHTAINLPSGSPMARLFENLLPSSWPWGGFLLAVCDAGEDAQGKVHVGESGPVRTAPQGFSMRSCHAPATMPGSGNSFELCVPWRLPNFQELRSLICASSCNRRGHI